MKVKFSLVIPCYNEADNLPLLVDRCKDIAAIPETEVVFVDNGSTDGTACVLRDRLPRYSGFRSIRVEKNQGYGFGILSGLAAARGNILGWTHADMQTDPQDALRGLELFAKHGENIFVKGRRYGRPLMDVAFTVGMSAFETLLLARPLWDINAQPTMFSHQFRDTWDGAAPHDFSLDLFAYYRAHLSGLSVHRFPVRFSERAHGVSHWNVNWAAKRKFVRRTVTFSLALKRRTDA